MTKSGFDIENLFQEAQSRWLKPVEVLFILQNHEKYQLTLEAPQRPPSGSLFLFNRRVTRYFRKDGHNWRKKRDGRTVGEAHERLKVGNVETLNCYYAHGEDNPNFQRRSFWILDPEYDYIVLVHYREINEGRPSPGTTVQSPGSSTVFSATQNSFPSHNLVFSSSYESSSPGSTEVSSVVHIGNNGLDRTGLDSNSPAGVDVDEALQRLKQQLSLNDETLEGMGPFESQEAYLNESENFQYGTEISKQDQQADIVHGSDYNIQGENGEQHLLPVSKMYVDENKEYWNDVLDSCKSSSGTNYMGKSLSWSTKTPVEQQQPQWLSFNGSSFGNMETLGTDSDYYAMLFNQGLVGAPLEEGPQLTVAQKQKFLIRKISPEWGFSDEPTNVIMVGSFLCNPSESAWACMFGEDEVPVEIIQDGVICCEAPPHCPGKVTICVTSGNRESCSEVRQFEYRAKKTGCSCNLSPQENSKSTQELLLLVQFVQMLLSDNFFQREDNAYSGLHSISNLNNDDDSWSHVIEALLVGSGTSSGIIDWLLQQLLKEKLQQWLSSRTIQISSQPECSLSKKDQGIIHMVAGLGFEWALNPILSSGVGVNFRDINGWTALHWAARFGREKMVASLIASGASAGAVTDPSAQDPRGQTPASIAACYGHKGLAGYLSEVSLTSHLSSLVLEESELSKGSAEVEAERTLSSISQGTPSTSEDQLSLKDTLAAVRNATQAAARIQNAFRAHSFRKRQHRDAATAGDYGSSREDIQGLSAISKLTFGNYHDHNLAALSIQKKYRGWKGRKDFLALRQKVVKIQAHVRGYQVRKNYRAICWAVGVLDKVVLRWRRKGVGLRGFRPEIAQVDENEDEDILKVFRREKVDATIDESVSRVVSMVDSPQARHQYRRMLERYRQAKAELGSTSETALPAYGDDFFLMEDEVFKYM